MDARAWDLWRRRVRLWTLTLGATAGAVTWALWGGWQAFSVAVGTLLGALNLAALAGSARRLALAAQASPMTHEGQGSSAATAWALVRWPVAALATAAVLWYMPGRPEGLAAGVFTALLAFCLAALQTGADLSRDDDPDPQDR